MEGLISAEEFVSRVELAGLPWMGMGTMAYAKMLDAPRDADPVGVLSAAHLGLIFNEMSRTGVERELARRRAEAELAGPKAPRLPRLEL